MPTANEMFNAYFAPAAADWQKESHLRTNAEARAKMQEMEDAHMAEWRKRQMEPEVAPTVIPAMTAGRPSVLPSEQMVNAANDTAEQLMTARGNLIVREREKARAEAQRAGRKMSPEELQRIAVNNADYELGQVPEVRGQLSQVLMSQKSDRDRMNANAKARSLGLSSFTNASNESGTSSVTDPRVSMSGSSTRNDAVAPLIDPVQKYVTDALTRKGPDTSEQEARAAFIRGELPRLERELMLTGGAEEYRKRLAAEQAGIAAANTAFANREDDLLKTSIAALKEAGVSERQAIEIAGRKQLAAFKNGSMERIAKMKADVDRYKAGIGGAGDRLKALTTMYGHQIRAIGTMIGADTKRAVASIFMGQDPKDTAKRDILNNMMSSIAAEIRFANPDLVEGDVVSLVKTIRDNSLETDPTDPTQMISRGSAGGYTTPGVDYNAIQNAFGKPDVSDTYTPIPGNRIAIPPMTTGKARTPNPPDKPARTPDTGGSKFKTRAEVLAAAKGIKDPKAKAAFLVANSGVR